MGGYPNSWLFFGGKYSTKNGRFGGTPISGKLHTYIYIDLY